MVRISNKEIPDKKNIRAGLTNIYGIGWSTAEKIINKLGIGNSKRIRDLSETEIKSISEKIKQFSIEGELKEKIQKNISEQISLGTYKGLRRSRRPNPLPIHGQRTRHNARTAKGHKRITIANKKKAPTPK
ncbi:ribosomal protein uS13 [endosymbiont GvMRE of Glomus versiforme]|uniref:ribosomal protein uS13 n=1 Tax=endosymbiont GvMRE of Glomus versiforme TaxID=2039283 RepID=UPI000ED65157|nr:30S ribosomal protein S13 [endosymbiont GvMRE of Glomus versiforme]RHZ35375.1 30S ribosomal protein S13 [endosymbiont GvMRE of Glomus versiforme]